MAAVNQAYVNTCTRNVFLYGNYELHDNKGPLVPDVKGGQPYIDAVMQNARNTLEVAQINNALASNYITQVEYDAIMALVPVG
jgi:hypothetical protein